MSRYIDADKLKDEFCEACSTHKRYHLSVEECRAKERPDRKWCFKMRLIDETPAADVAPRADVIEEYRQRVNTKMGKHTHLLGKEYVQRILREVAKEMKNEQG